MTSIARWCFRHKKRVLGMWLAAFIILGAINFSAGSGYSDSFTLPGTESTTAFDLLGKNFKQESTDTNQVVFGADDVTAPETRQKIDATLQKIADGPHVERVDSPFAKDAAARQVAQDKTVAFANVHMDGEQAIIDVPKSAYDKVIDNVEKADTDGLNAEVGGSGIQQAVQAGEQGGASELIGFLAAAVVLALAFGSLFATLLPLGTAIISLGTALALNGLMAHLFTIATFSPQLATLIGLGVGIDYSLFVVTRHRNAIKNGRDPEEACVRALNTSGRAVLFAGATVIVALLGLLDPRRLVPQRRRDRRLGDRAGRRAGRDHADARLPGHDRDEGAVQEGAPPARGRGTARPQGGRALAAVGELRPAPAAAAGRRRAAGDARCSPSRPSTCGWAPPTRARTRRTRRRARPTTCSPRASAPASTAPSRS